jgi:protein gp37
MGAVIAATPEPPYQVLTKRCDRLARMVPRVTWPQNIWMGVTAEDECAGLSIPFFFKQRGGRRKNPRGRILDEVLWNGYPRIASAMKG